jgi:hypothetical protein
VQDGLTKRWKATGEAEGIGWLEAWGATLVEAMDALQVLAARRMAEQQNWQAHVHHSQLYAGRGGPYERHGGKVDTV